MDAAHRKIELQASEDFSYLVANVRRAAAARIDEAFPPVEGAHDEDELRTRIEELVEEYITKTFTLASPNLSINGLPVDPSHFFSSSSSNTNTTSGNPPEAEEIYEPFDARKRARVEELTRDEEDLLRDIAALKRGVPAAAAASWAEAARRGVREDEEALAVVNARASAHADGESAAAAAPEAQGQGMDMDMETRGKEKGGEKGTGKEKGEGKKEMMIEPLDRQQDVEAAYDGAVHGLGRLGRQMPAVVARMERARGAGEYVVTER
ncbi:hypothetical protein F4779DRAFT_619746 [Xylariaceae sp. FL0662B]|nr:hypothetical protein F4779DRAFT_619746 [Xylariaceae sp. FL0662B]